MKGINGKILKVNLSNNSTEIEKKSNSFYRKYIGGRGFGLYYLHKEMPANTKPFSPNNLLIFATSIIVGAPGPAIPRFTVCAKSPLTNSFGESEAGGYFGPELKKAGFDAIVIKGKADVPCYIWIEDGNVEIKDAKDLWGKVTGETQKIIREEVGHENARIAQIGPGGENLVRYANITNELAHFNGRNGLGAVMGSKNLKAIAVKGNKQIKVENKDEIKKLSKWVATKGMENPKAKTLREFGTLAAITPFNEQGILPTQNWHKSFFDGAENISGEKFMKTIGQKPKGCFACPIRCKRVAKVNKNGFEVSPKYGGPEYESMVSLGSILEIDNLNVIAKANELCNKLTIDTISTGMTIGFAMDCYEKGLLNGQQCNNLDLRFGNEEVLIPVIKKIARREGVGELLAEGTFRAANEIGNDASKYIRQVKGQEIPMHDPRVKTGVGIQYATASYGADHMKAVHDSYFADENSIGTKTAKVLGIYDSIDPQDLNCEKVAMYKTLDLYWTLIDSLGACCFGFEPRGPIPIKMLVKMVNDITGLDFSLWELMKASERNINMARELNFRENIDHNKDVLPEVFFNNFSEGPLQDSGAIDEESFYKNLKNRNEMMGWDSKTGRPKIEKLYELNIEWIRKSEGEGQE